MARKKSEKLTPRQRQSRRIMREKGALKRWREMKRRMQWAAAFVSVATLIGGGAWAWTTGAAARTWQAAENGAWQLTADAGFAVQSLYLEGRSRTDMADIEKALGADKGDPILRLSLDDMRRRLENIEGVRLAAVERELPGTLYVRIIERQPVALWQHRGRLIPVDDSGTPMTGIDPAPYRHLPLIVGDGAPGHAAELLAMLASEPALAKRFAAAVYVGERRWNVRLTGGIEIKLPEEAAAEAWKTLAGLQARQKLLDRTVKVIDLRVAGRLFIKMSPKDTPETADAKET